MEVEEVCFLRAKDGKLVDFWALEDSMGQRMSRRAGEGIRPQQEDLMLVARNFDPPKIHYFRKPL